MLRFVLCFVLLAGFFGSAEAQQCENGQCQTYNSVGYEVQATQPTRGFRARRAARAYGSVGSAAVTSYGSTGTSAVSYGSTGYSQVVTSYGSTGSSVRSANCTCVNCQCGQVTQVYPEVSSFTQISSDSVVGSLGVKSRRASREVILAAAKTACDECTITPAEFQAIRMAVKSPRMLARIEDMILAQAQASGAYNFALDVNGDPIKSAINWEAIGDFILKIAPIIFKLIEMFAYYETIGDVQGMAMIMANLNYLATLHWQSQMAC